MFRLYEARSMNGGLKGLSKAARICLVHMAMAARDTATETEPEGCYFRGWEHLAWMLGHEELDAAGKRAVTRAVAELARAGLIERDHYPARDRRKAVYRLRL